MSSDEVKIKAVMILDIIGRPKEHLVQSLTKLIEGEVINDFLCEGCNKKVDISKRTLIS